MWAMVMTLIPIVGFILYLLLGQDYKKRKMFKLKEEEDYFYLLLLTIKLILWKVANF